ncbi:hypothetical protein MPSEU_000564700 [Mayamaea pseudoterrestris]|nr:hypothetical protein MPSEU_000564700 [Mayamaea pseudoterrestris]
MYLATPNNRPPVPFRNRQLPPTQPAIKLKCLVLGASSAGKTSLLRRYFYGNFEGNRVPTLGSDWYTKRLKYPSDHTTSPDNEIIISLQLWDTPGRERLDAKRPGGQQQRQLPSLQESFLRQADAYMLVYDVTSSTSFKQLLKWYADLEHLIKKTTNCSSTRQPILIVGTKMDLLHQARQTGNGQLPATHKRRSILGLQDKAWAGQNYQYEYQVSKTEFFGDNIPDQTASRQNTRRMEIASYLADRENWTTDWSYLDSLLSSEDGSHPDRDMVVLWCGRNDLLHMDASAATGEGVEEVIFVLVRLALETKRLREEEWLKDQHPQVDTAAVSETTPLRYHKKLDLHQRYATNDDRCRWFCWYRLCRKW